MNSRHTLKTAITVRVEEDLRVAANAAVENDEEWTIALYVASCLKALAENPDAALKFAARHRVERTPRGRPKSAPSE